MGRLIDVSNLRNTVMLNKSQWGIFATQIDQLVEGLVSQVSTVEAIPKADYETRLKADKMAMLKEIQLEIEELEKPHCHNASHADGCVSKWKVEGVIQKKINALKAESEDKE